MKIININDTILVKLNKHGKLHYIKNYNEFLPDKLHITFDIVNSNEDENGYTSMLLWRFMNVFGKEMELSRPLLFDGDLILMNNE